MYRLVQRRGIIGLFCLLFVASSVVPGWAQKDNRFEVSKNLDIFNSLLKEVEMFYVDSVDVDKTVQRGIEAMLAGLDPYTEYYPEQKTEELSLMTTGSTDVQIVVRPQSMNTLWLFNTGKRRVNLPSESISVVYSSSLLVIISGTSTSKGRVEGRLRRYPMRVTLSV